MIGSTNRYTRRQAIVAVPIYLALGLGLCMSASADTYGELNAQREEAELPLLTGNDQTDFQMLAVECRRGIRYSCALARRLQDRAQQRSPQYQSGNNQPVPVYGPESGLLQGLPVIPGFNPNSSSQRSSPRNGGDSYSDQASECNAQPGKVWVGYACRSVSNLVGQ